MTQKHSLRILVEKYQYKNPAGTEYNKGIFPYWRRCCFRRSIKTIEYESAHRKGQYIQWKSHKSYYSGGNSCSDFTLQWRTQYIISHSGHIWYIWDFCCNEIWSRGHCCTAEQKTLSTRGSCATKHAGLGKSGSFIREACTHYSPSLWREPNASETCCSIEECGRRRQEAGEEEGRKGGREGGKEGDTFQAQAKISQRAGVEDDDSEQKEMVVEEKGSLDKYFVTVLKQMFQVFVLHLRPICTFSPDILTQISVLSTPEHGYNFWFASSSAAFPASRQISP